jgi:hypothetical protein
MTGADVDAGSSIASAVAGLGSAISTVCGTIKVVGMTTRWLDGQDFGGFETDEAEGSAYSSWARGVPDKKAEVRHNPDRRVFI